MDENDIIKAIGERLATIPDLPFVLWENKSLPEDVRRPYLVFELNPSRSRSQKISGSRVMSGFAQISVVGELNNHVTSTNDLAETIAALFPNDTVLQFTGWSLSFPVDTIPSSGFRSGADWIKPVQIEYLAL